PPFCWARFGADGLANCLVTVSLRVAPLGRSRRLVFTLFRISQRLAAVFSVFLARNAASIRFAVRSSENPSTMATSAPRRSMAKIADPFDRRIELDDSGVESRLFPNFVD